MVGISVEGAAPAVHRAMRGKNADLYEVMDAIRLVRKESGVGLKLATVVSGVNRDNLLELARTVRDLAPDVWRLYQYSSRGDQNFGQRRHHLPEDEFQRLTEAAMALAAPVPTAPSTETDSTGCLIVDPAGNVSSSAWRRGTVRHGNLPGRIAGRHLGGNAARSAIMSNKRWLTVLACRVPCPKEEPPRRDIGVIEGSAACQRERLYGAAPAPMRTILKHGRGGAEFVADGVQRQASAPPLSSWTVWPEVGWPGMRRRW